MVALLIITMGLMPTLTFAFESKNKFYYNSDIHNGLHAFNKPLGAYPIDAEINTGTHTYTLKSKP